MKWNIKNVSSARGNTKSCIAKFDNCRVWIGSYAIMYVQNFKRVVREIGKLYGAKAVEVKYLYDEEEMVTEPKENIVLFLDYYSTERCTRVHEFFTTLIDHATGRIVRRDIDPKEIFDTIQAIGTA